MRERGSGWVGGMGEISPSGLFLYVCLRTIVKNTFTFVAYVHAQFLVIDNG